MPSRYVFEGSVEARPMAELTAVDIVARCVVTLSSNAVEAAIMRSVGDNVVLIDASMPGVIPLLLYRDSVNEESVRDWSPFKLLNIAEGSLPIESIRLANDVTPAIVVPTKPRTRLAGLSKAANAGRDAETSVVTAVAIMANVPEPNGIIPNSLSTGISSVTRNES